MKCSPRLGAVPLLLSLTFAPVLSAAPRQVPSADRILDTLRPRHPRLLIDAPGFEALRARLETDPRLQEADRRMRTQADELLDTPTRPYEIPDGKRLLSVSREVLRRSTLLALMFRLHGDERHRQRLFAELASAAAFKDWNPSHFLDTGEMTHAFAIAYDWLYEDWTPEQRVVICTAIVELGLTPGRKSYDGTERYGWWVRSHHNWNQVCNGGMIAGALAVADEEPQLARTILAAAVESLPRALHDYAPDGAWPEGPGYWTYANSYTVLALAMLDSALGSDLGLSDAPGFDRTGLFGIHATGPTGRTFNFSDAGDSMNNASFMRWLGRRFERPEYDGYADARPRFEPLDFIWLRDPGQSPVEANLPRDALFRGVEVACFRSRWEDPGATYLAIQAGSNTVNHNHLDLGSFVLDAAGERWIVDMRHDDYNLPGYFGSKRYLYYRNRAESHNTLVIDPSAEPDQDPGAGCRIERFQSGDEMALAIADLTPAYARSARSVKRGVALIDRLDVLVQDEIATEAAEGVEVYWLVHTPAKVTLSEDGRVATLTQDDRTLTAVLAAPAELRFTADRAGPLPASPRPEGQDDTPDLTRLTIHAQHVGELTLAVRFNVGARAESGSVTPLASW